MSAHSNTGVIDIIDYISSNTEDIKDALHLLPQEYIKGIALAIEKSKSDRLRNMSVPDLEPLIEDFKGKISELIFLLTLFEEKSPGRTISGNIAGGMLIWERE